MPATDDQTKGTNEDVYSRIAHDSISERQASTLLRKASVPRFKLEVRSAFGWTDLDDDLNISSPKRRDLEAHQKSLPRLPIPDLQKTCDLLLQSCEAVLTPEEFEKTKAVTTEFRKPGGDGEKLQHMLQQFDQAEGPNAVPSWLEPWWDAAYVKPRDPIAINVNYFFCWEDDPKPANNNQIGRAASLLEGAVEFLVGMRSGNWSLDTERGKPLCMSQYRRVFCASRIPKPKRDVVVTYSKNKPSPESPSFCSKTTTYVDEDPTHVVVMYRNRFFWFDVIKDNQRLEIGAVEAALAKIKKKCDDDPQTSKAPPVGVFTAANRDDWAACYEKMCNADAANKHNFELIHRAIIVVVLEDIAPADDNEFSRLICHGTGTNRWFDKHCMIVCANGRAGINFEHSVGDGATTLRVVDEMYEYSKSHTNPVPSAHDAYVVETHELHWSITDELRQGIIKSYSVFKQAIMMNETASLHFSDFGGSFIKHSGFSPDAFTQVALQLTYYGIFGELTGTYEAASTRQFLHGRTETVRSCTKEVHDFCTAVLQTPLLSTQKARTHLFDLLKKATEAHVGFMRQAKQGHGVDRHLFGLKMMSAVESNYESRPGTAEGTHKSEEGGHRLGAAFFNDAGVSKSSRWVLSTSHCGSPSLRLFGFGPVVIGGFGIGYMIKNNSISFNVTSKYYNNTTSSKLFVLQLQRALFQLQSIVLSHPSNLEAQESTTLAFVHPTNMTQIDADWSETQLWDTVFGY
eukprot:TRINITY_DN61952_c0_g1_i1.p1 TRINITY_DN61952_c0_g1~~TRINITY_DN61952_c0_g1_i1.p1  ORF type:complete len:742 (+),score=90.42 TRINITY_DN61952_c0_g1_i1:18-2243(+)